MSKVPKEAAWKGPESVLSEVTAMLDNVTYAVSQLPQARWNQFQRHPTALVLLITILGMDKKISDGPQAEISIVISRICSFLNDN